jgi:cyanophycin synthetase
MIGVSLSNGLYKNEEQILHQSVESNSSGLQVPYSNRLAVHKLITDHTLDCALLETSLEDIITEGLPYDFALIGVVLNVKWKQSQDIDLTREDDIAYAKSVVAEQVLKKGYAILNADDPLVMEMPDRLDSRIIFFTANDKHPLLGKLKTNSKLSVVYLENKHIIYFRMGDKLILTELNSLPYYRQTQDEYTATTLLALTACLLGLKWQPEKIVNRLVSL